MSRWIDKGDEFRPEDYPEEPNHSPEYEGEVGELERPYKVVLHVRVPVEGAGLISSTLGITVARYKLDEFLSVLNDNNAVYTVTPLFKMIEEEEEDE